MPRGLLDAEPAPRTGTTTDGGGTIAWGCAGPTASMAVILAVTVARATAASVGMELTEAGVSVTVGGVTAYNEQ
jgi:hypothetical protein